MYAHHTPRLARPSSAGSSISSRNVQPIDTALPAQLVSKDSDKRVTTADKVRHVAYRSIIGQYNAKRALVEAAILPALLPSNMLAFLNTTQTLLLTGPPGTGKTALLHATAHASGRSLFVVRPADVLSKWTGEGERFLKTLFNDAKRCAPSIIFIDECDALAPQRGGAMGEDIATRRLLTQLLLCINELEDAADGSCALKTPRSNAAWHAATAPSSNDLWQQEHAALRATSVDSDNTVEELPALFCASTTPPTADITMELRESAVTSPRCAAVDATSVVLVAATNRPQDCDPAFLRRFNRRVEFSLPSDAERHAFITARLLDVCHTLSDADVWAFARRTEGWNYADLQHLMQQAVQQPFLEATKPIIDDILEYGVVPELFRDAVAGISTTVRAVCADDIETVFASFIASTAGL